MIIINQMANGHITAARSDDGQVCAPMTPLTALYGEFRLVDESTGRDMWRGLYPDPDGYYRSDKVPAHIWASAVALMDQIMAHNNAVSDALTARALEREVARHNSLSERIAQDMDRADSDL